MPAVIIPSTLSERLRGKYRLPPLVCPLGVGEIPEILFDKVTGISKKEGRFLGAKMFPGFGVVDCVASRSRYVDFSMMRIDSEVSIVPNRLLLRRTA